MLPLEWCKSTGDCLIVVDSMRWITCLAGCARAWPTGSMYSGSGSDPNIASSEGFRQDSSHQHLL